MNFHDLVCLTTEHVQSVLQGLAGLASNLAPVSVPCALVLQAIDKSLFVLRWRIVV